MKRWMKISLGISVVWTMVMPFLMVYLILAPRPHTNTPVDPLVLRLMLLSLANFLLIAPAWVTFQIYAITRVNWPVWKRVVWVIGLIGGPWVLITWPWFYIRHILTHPMDEPLFKASKAS